MKATKVLYTWKIPRLSSGKQETVLAYRLSMGLTAWPDGTANLIPDEDPPEQNDRMAVSSYLALQGHLLNHLTISL
jgi:hypothetical protein